VTPAARVAAVRRGESRSGPARGWEGSGEVGEDTWTGAERRWGGGGAAHGRQSGGGARAEKQRRSGWRRKTRTSLRFSKNTRTSL
jgi:hypothetical protein